VRNFNNSQKIFAGQHGTYFPDNSRLISVPHQEIIVSSDSATEDAGSLIIRKFQSVHSNLFNGILDSTTAWISQRISPALKRLMHHYL